jgi:four helix bundle protein
VKSIEDRSKDLFIQVISLCKLIKITPINERIIKQVVASSGSIGANFQEASCAMSSKDFVKCLKISRKEAKETSHWLQGLSVSVDGINEKVDLLVKEANELGYILTSIISKEENKTKF